jgi:hypothetical protein
MELSLDLRQGIDYLIDKRAPGEGSEVIRVSWRPHRQYGVV